MGLKILTNHILGYVRIKVESVFIERFLNICISKKIAIWNIKREKATILYANIGIKDFKKLKPLAKKTKSSISIMEKKGILFTMHKYRKRKIFLVLFSVITISIFLMSNFIWNIELICEDDIDKQAILSDINKQGLKVGIAKKNVNTKQIINKIRLVRDDISWMGIDIKGTNAIIEIKGRDKAPEIIDRSEYCNIVADKTGIITKINVLDGIASVAEGDLVKEGDILVLGQLDGKYTGTRYVHSIADIEAKIWYEKKEKFFYNQQIPVPTGKTEQKYSVYIKNFKINFYKTLSKFQNYDTINARKKFILFPNFYIPIEIEKKINNEYNIESKTYTEEELTAIAEEKLQQEIEGKIRNKENIVNRQINTYKNADYIEVEMIYEVIESIGAKEKIVI